MPLPLAAEADEVCALLTEVPGTVYSPAWRKTPRASTPTRASTPSRRARWTRRATATSARGTGRNSIGRSAKRRAYTSSTPSSPGVTMLMEASTPLARPVPPEDVARTIVFLASERYSGSVHGQLIPIDGGLTGRVAWTIDELKAREV